MIEKNPISPNQQSKMFMQLEEKPQQQLPLPTPNPRKKMRSPKVQNQQHVQNDDDEGFHDVSSLSFDRFESNGFSSDSSDEGNNKKGKKKRNIQGKHRKPSQHLNGHINNADEMNSSNDEFESESPNILSSKYSKISALLPSANPLLDKSVREERVTESLFQFKNIRTDSEYVNNQSRRPLWLENQQNAIAKQQQKHQNGFLDEKILQGKNNKSHFTTLYEKYFSAAAAGSYRLVYSKFPSETVFVDASSSNSDIAACFINLKEQFQSKPQKQQPQSTTQQQQPTITSQITPSTISSDPLLLLKHLHPLQYVKPQINPTAQRSPTAEIPQAKSLQQKLQFNSKFESGNLMYAFEKIERTITLTNIVSRANSTQFSSSNEYDLLICSDINSKGYAQWFYFSVANIKQDTQLRFNIVNHSKKTSLFKSGMKPAVFSTARNSGWERGGSNIKFYENEILKDPNRSETYSSLSFSYTSEFDSDTVYFAMTFPYTYSEMIDHVDNLISQTTLNLKSPQPRNSTEKIYMKKETLCESIAGFPVPLITITNGNEPTATSQTSKQKQQPELNQKKVAIIIARQHPGETVSSFLMEGLLEFLASPTNPEAEYLRNKYIFKIAPMLNPDGVIFGNFRCNLSGTDLNRQWTTPHKLLHPCVYALKRLMQKCLERNQEIDYFIDLHGHSKKLNSFVYACKVDSDPFAAQIFPMILSKINPIYHFPSCTFGLDSYKENTARGIAWNSGVTKPNIFTIETSFFGYKDNSITNTTSNANNSNNNNTNNPQSVNKFPFSKQDLFKLGFDLGRTMFIYHSEIINKDSKQQSTTTISKATILSEITQAADQCSKTNGDDDSGSDRARGNNDGGSDSDPLADELEVTEKINKVLGKKIAKSIGLVLPKPKQISASRNTSSNILATTSQRRVSRKSFEEVGTTIGSPQAAGISLSSNAEAAAGQAKNPRNQTGKRQMTQHNNQNDAGHSQQATAHSREKSRHLTERSLSRSNANSSLAAQIEREKEIREKAIDLEARQFRIKNIIAMKQNTGITSSSQNSSTIVTTATAAALNGTTSTFSSLAITSSTSANQSSGNGAASTQNNSAKTSNLLLNMNLNASLRYKQTSNILNSPSISISGQSFNIISKLEEYNHQQSEKQPGTRSTAHEEQSQQHHINSIYRSKLDGSQSQVEASGSSGTTINGGAPSQTTGGALLKILAKQCEYMTTHYPASDSIMYDNSPLKNQGLLHKSRINSATGGARVLTSNPNSFRVTERQQQVQHLQSLQHHQQQQHPGSILQVHGILGSNNLINPIQHHGDQELNELQQQIEGGLNGIQSGSTNSNYPPQSSTSITALNAARVKAESKRMHEQQEQNHNLIQNFSKILKENSKKYKCDTKMLFLTRAKKQNAAAAAAAAAASTGGVTPTDIQKSKSTVGPSEGLSNKNTTISPMNSASTNPEIGSFPAKSKRDINNTRVVPHVEDRFSTQVTDRDRDHAIDFGRALTSGGYPHNVQQQQQSQLTRFEESQQRTQTNPNTSGGRRESFVKRATKIQSEKTTIQQTQEDRNFTQDDQSNSNNVAANLAKIRKNKQQQGINPRAYANTVASRSSDYQSQMILADFGIKLKVAAPAALANDRNSLAIPQAMSFVRTIPKSTLKQY